MGMDEPLMNYDAVMKSVEILSNESSVGISARWMTISTAGWAEYILLEGLNDTEDDVHQLISLSKMVPCKVNVNPCHPIDFTHPTGFAATLRPTSV